MFNWLHCNLGNLLVGGVLIAVIACIIRNLRRKRKNGACIGCSGKCDHCLHK